LHTSDGAAAGTTITDDGSEIIVVANEHLRNGIAVLVACVWALAAVDGILTQNWTGLGIVTPMMMLIGGFLFGFKHEAKKADEKPSEIKPPSSRGRNDDLADW
jgi:hypothetical protein